MKYRPAPAPAALGSCTAAAYRKASQYCEDNPRPPRYTPLNRSRLPRRRRQKRNINSATSSLATVRRTGEARYPKSPRPHRCGREPDLSNYPQDRVCGSEGRGSERRRRLLGDADPRHFRRHHLSHCRPASGPHDIRLRLDAAPLPARGGLRPDRPLRGHRPLRTEPAARKGCRCFVEARLRSAAMPFPRQHRRSRNGLDDRVPDLAHTAQWLYQSLFGYGSPESIGQFLSDILTTSEGWVLIIAGSGIGFLFAVFVLTISVVSFPLLLDRDVGAMVAMHTSVRAVLSNPLMMAAWGLFVAVTLVIGSLPFFVGLAVVMPVLAHSTWHLYRKVVEPDLTPR